MKSWWGERGNHSRVRVATFIENYNYFNSEMLESFRNESMGEQVIFLKGDWT